MRPGPHRTSADARVSNSSTVIVRSLSSGTVVPRSRSIVMRPFFWQPSHSRSSLQSMSVGWELACSAICTHDHKRHTRNPAGPLRLEEALCRRHPVETFAGRRFSRDQLLPGQRCRPADYLLGCAGLPWMVLLLEQPQQHFASWFESAEVADAGPRRQRRRSLSSQIAQLCHVTFTTERPVFLWGLAVPGAFLCASVADLAAMMCEPGRIVAAPTPESSADRLAPRSRNAWSHEMRLCRQTGPTAHACLLVRNMLLCEAASMNAAWTTEPHF